MDLVSYTFELPLGYIKDIDGTIFVEKEVEVVPMTVKVRKALTKKQFKNNPSALFNFILKSCVVKLAGEEPSFQQIKNLSSGDRQYLLLMIRKISLGDTLKFQLQCDVCEAHQQAELDIDHIRVKRYKDDELPVQDKRFVIHFSSESLGLDCKMKLPTGIEEEMVASIQDPLEANYKMYEYCLVQYNEKVAPFSSEQVDRIPVKISDFIDKRFRELQPGPDYYKKVLCDSCGGSTLIDLSKSDFLFTTQD